ncbi:type II/IV secretion system ATPase subunit [Methanolacinia paynteri]|uniref:type II/IV secretion system ATPase subunit n=1 Tax=Methanolacinia paynteri TaxID=230356 RepID=UPI001FE1EDE9|nr:ATPase, T2SS/T4P/T4SS family [Methanolacinia paynteri]
MQETSPESRDPTDHHKLYTESEDSAETNPSPEETLPTEDESIESVQEESAKNADGSSKINTSRSATLSIKNNFQKINSGNTEQAKGRNDKKIISISQKFNLKSKKSEDKRPEGKNEKISSISQKLGLKTKKDSNEEKKVGDSRTEGKDKKVNSISQKFNLKSKKDKNEEKKAEDGQPGGKEDISGKFRDYLAILKNMLQSDNPELEQVVITHADYPENPEIKPGLLPDSLEILESYWLYPPHSYAVIVKDEEKNLQYMIFEPKITEKEHIILEETDAQLRSVVLYDSKPQNEQLNLDSELVYKIVKNLDQNIADDRIEVIRYYLYRNFKGYGKLDPLMHDENIEDITCNGPDIPVFIFHRKYSNLPVNIIFEGGELNRFVLKIAQKADKQLSLTAPLVDAALPEGARAQITYTDVVSSKGSSFTIRKFKSDPMTPVDLIDYGTYDAEILAFIWLCVENRKSAIVVGGTASGKTSMMNAFSLFIPHLAKIVSIEDTREIQMPHKNWLPMKTRESSSESGKGNVDMFSLLKTALRQRPEYIIVGEVRGSEAQTLFQAMNTGHTTYSTLHAGGVEQAINRLTTNPINVPVAMFGALDLMIIQQLQYIGGRMVRRCITIDEIVAEKNDISYNILYKWNPVKDVFRKVYKESKIINDIAYSHGWTVDETLNQIEIRKEILEGLLNHSFRSSDEITSVFEEFAKSGSYEFEE